MLKRRNLSKQNMSNIKYTSNKSTQKLTYFNLNNTNSISPQRINKNNHKQKQNKQNETVKRNMTSSLVKLSSSFMNFDSKYGYLNKKIKDILQSDEKSDKTSSLDKYAIKLDNINMTKSLIVKKNQPIVTKQNDKQNLPNIQTKQPLRNNNNVESQYKLPQKKQILPNLHLYFLQCIRRKNSLTTQFYINIHTSILTFKQFYKLAIQSKAKPIDRNIPSQKQNRKTIVFDMDQTLIHTHDVITPGYELKVPFKAIQGKVTTGYVNVRPYAKELLRRLSQYFDIIVFTAGNKCYADPILDHIDPNGIIQHRLYRESCTFVANQFFTKDLRILGRKLQNVVLVDNAPYSYMMQLANGIPILNYFKGKQDNQLYYLEKYLMGLLQVTDVREVNSEYFRLHEYMKFDSHQRLINALYSKKL